MAPLSIYLNLPIEKIQEKRYKNDMRILGVETSCDETAIAILEIKGKKNPRFNVLYNVISSQIEIHRPYGGVYPSLAKREHTKNLPVLLSHAKDLRLKKQKIDAIAVTVGPGLDPCLWSGIEFVKKLAEQWKVPIIPVNHLEGHLLISFFKRNRVFEIPAKKSEIFPAIALIVSGGHTQLIVVEDIKKYKVVGETRDDAAGECFDKTARILGLPYPGGPAIEKWASEMQKTKTKKQKGKSAFKITLPRPMIYSKDLDFSFSGLKTAVLYDWKTRPNKIRKSKEYIRAMAKEIQQAVIDVLIAKTLKAVDRYRAKSIILGGGVAANQELRKQLSACLTSDVKHYSTIKHFFVAPPELCTDNGLMIALAGYFNLKKRKEGKSIQKIVANPNLRLK